VDCVRASSPVSMLGSDQVDPASVCLCVCLSARCACIFQRLSRASVDVGIVQASVVDVVVANSVLP